MQQRSQLSQQLTGQNDVSIKVSVCYLKRQNFDTFFIENISLVRYILLYKNNRMYDSN